MTNVEDVIVHLVRKYDAKPFDLTPYTRVWRTRSGHTYCIKSGDVFTIYHRSPNGAKWNFYRDIHYKPTQIAQDCKIFINKMEKTLDNDLTSL